MFPLWYIYGDYAILTARILLALVLIARGWPRLKSMKGVAVQGEGAPARPASAFIFTPLIAVIEFFGGLALIFGFLVQPIAILLILRFFGGLLWKIARRQGTRGEIEADLLVVALAIVLLTMGGGFWALDNVLLLGSGW